MSFLTALSAGSSIIGGLSGLFGGDDAADQQAAANRFNEKQFQFQRTLAKHGISMRVRDAENAGLHPLFALGGSANYSPVNYLPGQSNTGSQVGSSLSQISEGLGKLSPKSGKALMTQAQLQTHQANIGMMESRARADDAQANYYNSQAKRLESESLTRGPALNPDITSGGPTPRAVANEMAQRTLERTPTVSPKNKPAVIKTGLGKFQISGKNSPAEAWEKEYGEPGQLIGGAINLGYDGWQNYKRFIRNNFKKAYKAMTKRERREALRIFLQQRAERY